MSLRIIASNRARAAETEADDWASRIAKLIPAEALALFGSATALLPTIKTTIGEGKKAVVAQALDPVARPWLYVIALVCAGLAVLIRKKAGAQNKAIIIALISFAIWLLAIGQPFSPFPAVGGAPFVGPLLALLWATIVPFIYKGD